MITRIHHEATYTGKALNHIERDLIFKCAKTDIRGLDSEELAQELRIHLWKNIHKYDPARSSFRTWSNAVMENKIRDFARKQFQENRDVLSDRHTGYILDI